jgi:hypothetical protein
VSGKVDIAGAFKPITSGRLYIGAAWKTITRGLYYNGSAWKTIATFVPPLSVTATPPAAFAVSTGNPIFANPVQITPTGGVPPYTYATVTVSYETDPPSLSGASTGYVSASCYDSDESTNACVFRSTVTDSLGSTATVNFQITFRLSTSGRL